MKKAEQNRGAAMVIVLCVIVIFLALSTTIVLAGSVALNTARNNVIYERGKVQAASLSEVFAKDMLNETSDLVRYVRKAILVDKWPAYDEESADPEANVKEFTMDRGDEQHQIRIKMYWTDGEPEEAVSTDTEDHFSDKSVCLFIDVISTLNDIEYHVKREFELKDTSGPNTTSEADYPYLWKWQAVGRNPDRGKESEGG